ncbi:hypothetical protein EIP91_005564 [Steccherinum ochraceum]|uniref:DNA recombination and repair protein Rad51-like C-terminal domain-containing protein n=1 Tax=Steccherinum ochraceum TaxID=92696 RepID=A0A4R0RTZ6_9APHY|nr:hypothetical protein EIP91_005564 [Steccherinum ochraceum]
MDGSFDMHRFRNILQVRIAEQLASNGTEDGSMWSHDRTDQLLEQCTRRVHIFRPASTLQLAFSLLHLPSYLANHPSSQHEELGMVVVDSINAFYWNDRYTMEQTRSGSTSTVEPPLTRVSRALHKVMIALKPLVVVTTRDLIPSSNVPIAPGIPIVPSSKQHLYPLFDPAMKLDDVSLGDPEESSGQDTVMAPPDVKPVLSEAHHRKAEHHLPLAFHVHLVPLDRPSVQKGTFLADALRAQPTLPPTQTTRGLVRGPVGLPIGEFVLSIRGVKILVEDGRSRQVEPNG